MPLILFSFARHPMVAAYPSVGGGMGLTLDTLRLRAARTLVIALWLHLPLVFGLAYFIQNDPLAPTAMTLVLSCLATAMILRRNLAPLGLVLVALAFGGAATIFCGVLKASPWHAVTPIYTAAALSPMLPLCSARAILAFAGLVLLPHIVLMWLGLAGIAALPPDAQGQGLRMAALSLEAGAFAGLAQALARALGRAEATATAARQEAESLWHQRTTAQMSLAQFIVALVDRLTGMAKGPATANVRSPTAATFPFDYADGLCCTNSVRDSSCGSSVITGGYD